MQRNFSRHFIKKLNHSLPPLTTKRLKFSQSADPVFKSTSKISSSSLETSKSQENPATYPRVVDLFVTTSLLGFAFYYTNIKDRRVSFNVAAFELGLQDKLDQIEFEYKLQHNIYPFETSSPRSYTSFMNPPSHISLLRRFEMESQAVLDSVPSSDVELEAKMKPVRDVAQSIIENISAVGPNITFDQVIGLSGNLSNAIFDATSDEAMFDAVANEDSDSVIYVTDDDNYGIGFVVVAQEDPIVIAQEDPIVIVQEDPIVIVQEDPIVIVQEDPIVIALEDQV